MKHKILLLAIIALAIFGCKKEEPEAQPIAKFTSSVKDQTVTFTNQSQFAKSYHWTFGDGTTSSEISPVKTYTKAGTYNVTLTAKNVTLSSFCSSSITITKTTPDPDPAPVAKFTYTIDGLKVSFKNQSTNAKTYSWDFGNGKTSTQTDPTITYEEAGTYNVCLTAKNGDKSHSYTQSIKISYSKPTAGFTFKTEAPLKVVLTNTSTNATSYAWDFGDGTTSTEKNPTHRYESIGSYIITLIAANPTGSQQYRETVKIPKPKVYVTGIQYVKVGKEGKYYRSVCQDDDFFTNTWWSTKYTPMLSSNNMPYTDPLPSPVELTGLEGDKYYTVYVYWNDKTSGSGDGTQIVKQKMYTTAIELYEDYYYLANDANTTQIRVLMSYK